MRVITLKWWFLACLSMAGAAVAAWLGLFHQLWSVDHTKLSFVILGLYVGATVFVGWLTWRLEAHTGRQDSWRFTDWRSHIDVCEEAAELCMRLAIMGTALGFLIALSAFSGAELASQATVAAAAKGIGVICSVTFVGVLCSSLLNLQLVNLRYLYDDETP